MLINGMKLDTISAYDRGLAYGDGHFTTMAVRDGRVLQWPAHLARLQLANSRLGLVEPDWDLLTREVEEMVADQPQCVAKVILTRGEGGGAMTAADVNTQPGLSLWRHFPLTMASGNRRGSRWWCAASGSVMPLCWPGLKP